MAASVELYMAVWNEEDDISSKVNFKFLSEESVHYGRSNLLVAAGTPAIKPNSIVGTIMDSPCVSLCKADGTAVVGVKRNSQLVIVPQGVRCALRMQLLSSPLERDLNALVIAGNIRSTRPLWAPVSQ